MVCCDDAVKNKMRARPSGSRQNDAADAQSAYTISTNMAFPKAAAHLGRIRYSQKNHPEAHFV